MVVTFYDKYGKPMTASEKLESLVFRARFFLGRFIPIFRPRFEREIYAQDELFCFYRCSKEESEYWEKVLRWVPGIISTRHPDEIYQYGPYGPDL